MRKTYLGIVRDHSASMRPLAKEAMADFNKLIDSIKASAGNEVVFVTVVECGSHPRLIQRVETNTPLDRVRHLTSYATPGHGTPLFDSIGEAIETLESVAAKDDEAAFLILAITDGEENASSKYKKNIGQVIRRLQATDRWTFTMRVPNGYRNNLTSLGIPNGNIIEWDQTEESLIQSTKATEQGISSYFVARSEGKRSTSSFYANAADIPVSQIKSNLQDVTHEANVLYVADKEDGSSIRDFVIGKLGSFETGKSLYQLTKPETVQDYKVVCIRDKTSGKLYKGHAARIMLGLPTSGTIRLRPGDNGQYDIFVQSNSVNRKLVKDTMLVYFK